MSFVIYSFAACYLCWILYVTVMALKRAKDRDDLSRVAYALGLPLLVIGIILDVLVNIVVCTVILLELPREWLTTARLKRHKFAGGWRGKVASWFCRNLLDAFDPSGCHCD